MQIDDFDPDDDDLPSVLSVLQEVAQQHDVELGVAPDPPSRFDAHHHPRPRLDDGPEHAAEIIAMQLTLAAANSRIVAAQEIIEAQRKRIAVLEAALRDARP